MIFLIQYDRDRGRIVTLKSFKDGERKVAEESRLNMELELNRQRNEQEVVLLEAATEYALRQTHRRYFEDLAELTAPAA